MEFFQTLATYSTLFASDTLVFVVLQLLLLVIVLYAAFAGRKRVHKTHRVRLNPLVLAYSILSASIIQAISVTELVAGFKLIITITDLAAAFYLCFMNPWFRSVVVGIVSSGKRVKTG